MRYYAAFMDLAGRDALVLGAGEVAERQAGALARAGARVRHADRFAPDLPVFAVEDFSDGVIWGVVRFTIRWHTAKAALKR